MITSPKASSQFQAGPDAAATDAYTLKFTTPPLLDGQTADGNSADKGQVVATQDGGRLIDPHIVLFTFVGQTSAQFLYENIPNVQPGSSPTMLMVMTNYNASLGQDVAQATFTDTVANNPVTVRAILQVPGAPSDTQDFKFTGSAADVYGLTIMPLIDHEVADGKAEDVGRAIVTKNGKALDNTDPPVLVTFTSSSTTTAFDLTKPYMQGGSTAQKLGVWTHNHWSGQTIADVYFTDTKPEVMTLTSALELYNVANARRFIFTAASQNIYDLEFNPPLANNQAAGGGIDEGQVYVTEDGGRLGTDQTVLFTFDAGEAKFVLAGDSNIDQSRSDSTHLYVKTHYDDDLKQDIANASFTDNDPIPVTLRAALVDHTDVQSKTQDFAFWTE